MMCPICGERGLSERGLPIHVGIKHRTRCHYNGDNRGWCVTHDTEWRIDRRQCQGILDPQP